MYSRCPGAMAAATIIAVTVENNPAPFTEDIVLRVQYECYSALQDDLEWKVIYVGSAESEQYDQVLDSAMVGPVQPGTYQFRMECPPPDPNKIPSEDLVGVTALLLTCSYRDKEFVRVGYYVNNEYTDPELIESPPEQPRIDKLQRNVLVDHPRVTKFAIDFDGPEGGADVAAIGDGGNDGAAAMGAFGSQMGPGGSIIVGHTGDGGEASMDTDR